MGFEPTTPTLARLCSTPELRPHPICSAGIGRLQRFEKRVLVDRSGYVYRS